MYIFAMTMDSKDSENTQPTAIPRIFVELLQMVTSRGYRVGSRRINKYLTK